MSKEGIRNIKQARQLRKLWVGYGMIRPEQEAELRKERPDLLISKWYVSR